MASTPSWIAVAPDARSATFMFSPPLPQCGAYAVNFSPAIVDPSNEALSTALCDPVWASGLFPLTGMDGPIYATTVFDDGTGPALYVGSCPFAAPDNRFLSRVRPEFMAKLFMQEVPEIYDGIIEVKSVAREP